MSPKRLFGLFRCPLSGRQNGAGIHNVFNVSDKQSEESGAQFSPIGSEGAVMDVSSVNSILQVPAATAPVTPAPQPAENREIIQAVKALNATEMFGEQNELLFQLDRQAQRVVVQVVNRKTREVVSQVPPEYVLRMAEDLKRGR